VLMDFEKLSNDLYYRSSHYKFAKKPTRFDQGYVKISEWVSELCWHYISRRKELNKQMEKEFIELIKEQKNKISALEPSAYKEGLLKALEETSVFD